MNSIFWLSLTLGIWPVVQGLYHELSKEVFKPPKGLRNDSYFGYSITYDSENSRLVISSPKENDIGVVYNCDVDSKNCTAVNVTFTRVHKNYTHDYWFGATVKAGPDFVVMCAPRYTDMVTYNSRVRFGTFGKCFKQTMGSMHEMMEISWSKRLKDSPNPFESTMDSFGWSIDVASDDSAIVGGPGMFEGRAEIYQRNKPVPTFISYSAKRSALNFGYGVSSGVFVNRRDLSYAVSSTYGKEGFGEVSFYRGVSRQLGLNKGVDPEVVGSMFGAVLCAAKLYGVYSDLLVGAPTYASKSTYNLGAVYVYKGNIYKKAQSPQYKRTIVGQTDGSMFGSAIVNLGDLNGDNKDEVAIGAPFENNGRGAVYIYSGADLMSEKTEKTLSWLQRIEAEPHSIFDKSFGMSLTPLLDYDHNGCNELAIGAPYSDAVVLIKCIAAITVHTTATFPNLQNRTRSGKTEFAFQVCLIVEEPRRFKEFHALVETSVEMYHTHAHLKNGYGPFKYQTLLKNGQLNYCKDIPFVLPLDGNYDTQINYQVSTILVENPIKIKKFEAARVILSDRSVCKLQDSVWAAECAGSKGCVPKLGIRADFSFKYVDHEYMIGSSETESFDISLFNTGEVAYDACVDVLIIGALVFEPPASCERDLSSDGDRLLCKPTKPLRNNETWSTGPIVLEMTHLTNQDQNITVNAYLRDRCTVADSKNFTFVTPITSDPSSIIVKGITDIGDIVDMTADEIESDGKNIQHVFEIVNRGSTNWKGLTSRVSLPKLPYIQYGTAPVTIYFSNLRGDTYNECPQADKEDADPLWIHYTCKIDSLMAKRQDVKINVPMFIAPGTIEYDTIANNNVTFSSKMTLDDGFGRFPRVIHTTSTILRLKEAIVPLWVIIAASLVGLCILIIIAFILYECGFLRRKERRNLQELRKSIRRQTIMRRSTNSAAQAAAEDRKHILEQMNEEDGEHHTEGENKASCVNKAPTEKTK